MLLASWLSLAKELDVEAHSRLWNNFMLHGRLDNTVPVRNETHLFNCWLQNSV